MSTQKAKFELYSRLADLGFTYEEAVQLRRIEMTLKRWSEQECGDSNDYQSWSIERDETTNKPYRCVYPRTGKMRRYPIADRESGALKRLKAIVDARNEREHAHVTPTIKANALNWIHPYHQTDPRGCSLYLVQAKDLPNTTDEDMRKHSGEWPLKNEETRLQWKLSCYYTRGLAVCC